ncbi:MAG: cytochrome c biosis protein [Dehalococcoidia bacterium]|nr:cytochrome c biosis protein [Dehalococcoidia bacterium]
MVQPVGMAVAFGAGLASFLAPCTLALVPGYVSYIAGVNLSQKQGSLTLRERLQGLSNAFLFACGFAATFTILGASLGALSEAFASFGVWLSRIGGIFIIVLGLMSLGLLRISFAERGYTAPLGKLRNVKLIGSFLVGSVFAIGWTPCVGPVLGAVFVLAGASGSAGQGALLLAAYALGMMLPFVAAGAAAGWTSWLLRKQGRWLVVGSQAAGVLLIGLGIVLFTGLMPVISQRLALGT